MAVETKAEVNERPTRIASLGLQGAVKEAFLITHGGLDELVGSDALNLEKRIKQDKVHSESSYRYYDQDKQVWAYLAVDADGVISPFTLPDLNQYSTTSPQLYTKAVVFPQIVARIVRKLKEVPPNMWDKLMKPTTIIVAIIGIIIVIALFMVAAQG